jgi:CheY-specific phosphatase CheX
VSKSFDLIEGISLETIADTISRATQITLEAILGERPTRKVDDQSNDNGTEIAGIISFFGEANACLAMLLSKETATNLVQRMVGFEIAFDSPDMNDGVGELVNVIAGEIVAQIDALGYQTAMSLPMVIRGKGVSISTKSNVPIIAHHFNCLEGPFTIEVVSRLKEEFLINKPGN